jgi:hypothetical protein
MFGANGRFRTETLEQGDVGHIPREGPWCDLALNACDL